jgi:hypothetical protein
MSTQKQTTQCMMTLLAGGMAMSLMLGPVQATSAQTQAGKPVRAGKGTVVALGANGKVSWLNAAGWAGVAYPFETPTECIDSALTVTDKAVYAACNSYLLSSTEGET